MFLLGSLCWSIAGEMTDWRSMKHSPPQPGQCLGQNGRHQGRSERVHTPATDTPLQLYSASSLHHTRFATLGRDGPLFCHCSHYCQPTGRASCLWNEGDSSHSGLLGSHYPMTTSITNLWRSSFQVLFAFDSLLTCADNTSNQGGVAGSALQGMLWALR